MKDPKSASRQQVCLMVAGAILTFFSIVPRSSGQLVTLTDANSLVQINSSGSSAGMNNWTVDGRNVLGLQWFWYRAGSMGSESRIDTISAPTITPTSASQARIGYFNGSYGVNVDYVLNGQAPGSGQSQMTETITIYNSSNSSQTFSFFQYSDFNLGGAPGDRVRLGTNFQGRFNFAEQTNGPVLLAESSITPGANRAEASIYPFTLNSLNDASITVLNNSTSAGPGDTTWAFEWDVTIAAGGSFGISKTLNVQVPEPSVAALITLGAVVCTIARRRQT